MVLIKSKVWVVLGEHVKGERLFSVFPFYYTDRLQFVDLLQHNLNFQNYTAEIFAIGFITQFMWNMNLYISQVCVCI